VHIQKLDPEPVHVLRTLATVDINKSKKGNASTTTSLPKRHRNIHRERSACAQHQAHGGFFEQTIRQQDPNHPITTSIHRNKYNKNIIVSHTNTTQYQNLVLQKSLSIICDGYVNKYTNPRRIETTTAAYHVEIQVKLRKTRPKTKQLTSSTQCPLCVFKAKNIDGLKIHNSKKHK
jgi:hypothetical protein